MPVRSSMAQIIARVRLLIGDPISATQQFLDSDIQDTLDQSRDDVRYLALSIAPSIVNTASTGNQASTIFADFYSPGYTWWEADITLQANYGGQAWVVVTPLASDLITGHWQFETNVFTTGTVPGQLPPVFATGKIFDINCAAADLLEMWAMTLSSAYDIVVDGQNLRRSQLMQQKLTAAGYYRKLAKPKMAKMKRTDVNQTADSLKMRLIDSADSVMGDRA